MIATRLMRCLSLVVRIAMVPVHILLVWLKRLEHALSRPRFRVRGSCQNNGACCERLFLMEGPFLSWPILRHLTHFWMTKIYPFQIHEHSMLHAGDDNYYRMVTCRNLVDGKCREYWLRPRLCRVWPVGDHERPPILFKGCGFWIEDRDHPEAGDASRRKPSYKREERKKLIAVWKEIHRQNEESKAPNPDFPSNR